MMLSAVKTLSVPNVPKVSVILTGLAPTRRTAVLLTLSVVTMTECATYPPLTPLIAVLTVTMGSVSEVVLTWGLAVRTAQALTLPVAVPISAAVLRALSATSMMESAIWTPCGAQTPTLATATTVMGTRLSVFQGAEAWPVATTTVQLVMSVT